MNKDISKAIALIIRFEGFFSKPYKDPVGIPTIGYGTIAYPSGKKVSMTDKECTHENALFWLKYEASDIANKLEDYLELHAVILNNNQFNALVCFAYNLGIGLITDKKSSMSRAITNDNIQGIIDSFMLYNKARKKYIFGISRMVELKGLTLRRQAELNLFTTRDV